MLPLLERTRSLLDKYKAGKTLRQIADASDGAVEYEWLKKFSRTDKARKPLDYSLSRVQQLHDYLETIHKSNAA